MMELVIMMNNREFNSKAQKFTERDFHILDQVTKLSAAVFFGKQAGGHIWQQRLMPGVPVTYWNPDVATAQVVAAVESGKLANAVQQNVRELRRLWSLVMALRAHLGDENSLRPPSIRSRSSVDSQQSDGSRSPQPRLSRAFSHLQQHTPSHDMSKILNIGHGCINKDEFDRRVAAFF